MADYQTDLTLQPLQQGEGWRLGWNPSRGAFPGLVGAEDWAIELTDGEFRDFCRLSQQLIATLKTIAGELMAEEHICCEVESDRIWLEVEGFPQEYELRLMLLTGRRAEGRWAPIAVPSLLRALDGLAAQLLDDGSSGSL
jgi:hypothetical protein